MTILIFILILSFLIIIHELGHFIAALWAKIKIEEFGLGYPPRALKLFTWRGIPFTLNWLPVGGFVKMEGEEGELRTKNEELKTEGRTKDEELRTHEGGFSPQSSVLSSQKQPFYMASKRQRLVVILAGATINFLFGVVAFSTVYTMVGIPRLTDKPIVSYVSPESPAIEAGIEIGDLVIGGRLFQPKASQPLSEVADDGINSETRNSNHETQITEFSVDGDFVNFASYVEVIEFINSHKGKELEFQIKRGDEVLSKQVYVRRDEERGQGEGAIGIAFDSTEFVHYPFWQMPFRGTWLGLRQAGEMSLMIIKSLGQIVRDLTTRGRVPTEVSGVIGIVHQASSTGILEEGFLSALNFAGVLSINLAIVNVLPIPLLDGGRAMFIILEVFIGPKRRQKWENKLSFIGIGFIVLVLIGTTLKDLWGIFN